MRDLRSNMSLSVEAEGLAKDVSGGVSRKQFALWWSPMRGEEAVNGQGQGA